MELDVSDALKLLLEHRDKLPPELVVEKLSNSHRNLYDYLDKLSVKDWEASKQFHGMMVGLYADFNQRKLLAFLQSSDNYPIQVT